MRRAVSKVGGIKRAAQICDVTGQTVHNWIGAGRIPGVARAIALAEAAKIDIKELA